MGRSRVLDSHSPRLLRGEDPVLTLNERLLGLTRSKPKLTSVTKVVHRLVASQEAGRTKECPRCGNLLPVDAFADSSLTTGVGRICNECKARSRTRMGPARKMKAQISTQQATASKNCPKCGSPMVRRTGRYGAFYGCSTYPSCRGTRRI